jgi:hypothetical protein
MKTLTLSLKKKWFDLIKAGVKKEEYREIKPYYNSRFCEPLESRIFHPGESGVKTFDRLVFTLGYPKAGDNERRLEFKNPKIRIGEGRHEWGAEPGKNYFVITWE